MNENDEGGFINPIKTIKTTYNKAKKFITSGLERFTSKVESILQKVGKRGQIFSWLLTFKFQTI